MTGSKAERSPPPREEPPLLSAVIMLRQASLMLEHLNAADTDWPDTNIYLHSSVVALRSVTLLMQRALRKAPGFAEWYSEIQDALRADPELRYLVEARNYVLKEHALRLLRQHRIESTTDNFTHLEIRSLTQDGPEVWVGRPQSPELIEPIDWRDIPGFVFETRLTFSPEIGLPDPPTRDVRALLIDKIRQFHRILVEAQTRFVPPENWVNITDTEAHE